MEKEEKIQKIISNYGNHSRRELEKLIIEKKVYKNGKLVKIGEKANINDKIEVDGKLIKFKIKHDYYILNKPKGYICERNAKKGKEAISLIDNYKNRNIFTIGRLDVLTTGLIIITSDGALSQKINRPESKIKKTYLVWVNDYLKKEEILKLKKGITIDSNYKTKPLVNLKIIKNEKEKKSSVFKLTLIEGKNNQIRKMFKSLEKEVINLKRISIGNININGLEIGKYKKVKKSEIYSLLNLKI